MKKIAFLFLAVISLISCQNEKTGFVDNGDLINEYQEKKDIETSVKEKFDAFGKKRDSVAQIFQLEVQQFQTLSKAQQVAQEPMLKQKQQFLLQQLQQEEQSINNAGQVEIDSLISKVRSFVKDYGKKNGYTYIFGANDAGSVMYGKDQEDITKTVLEALNTAYAGEEKE